MVKLFLLIVMMTSTIVWEEVGCLEFNFNFSSFDRSEVFLRNDAATDRYGDSLTRNSINLANNIESVGQMFCKAIVPLWTKDNDGTISLASFNTSFEFRIENNNSVENFGDGMAFLMSGNSSGTNSSGSSLGILNWNLNGDSSAQVVAVEFDTHRNPELADIDDNHVGIDVNNLTSINFKSLGKINISLLSVKNLKAWVDYDGDSMYLSVYVAPADSTKPALPFLSHLINLFLYLPHEINVGLSASNGLNPQSHIIFSWQFNSKDPLPTHSENKIPNGVIAGIVLAIVFVLLLPLVLYFVLRRKKKTHVRMSREFKLDDVALSNCVGPRRFNHKEIIIATRNFSKENYLGRGGFGPVYKGILPKEGTLVAVKSIGQNSMQGEREFVAEVTIISRIRHRNLVQLQGWCHDKGELFLVYDLMTNGSLDQHLFKKSQMQNNITIQNKENDEIKDNSILDWNRRYNIVCGLAAGLLYLHEEWEMQIIHRDVKSSNVMLDQDFNARLGDFGMARLVDHNMELHTTAIVGTFSYLAPEVSEIGKATSASDVYSFGIVTLEVACGRTAINYNAPPNQIRLTDWVWDLYSKGRLLEVADPRMGGYFENEEMERVLCLGLACSHPIPHSRPTMRQVHECLLNGTPTPPIPKSKPMVVSSNSFFKHPPTRSQSLSYTSTLTSASTLMLSPSSSNSMTIPLTPR